MENEDKIILDLCGGTGSWSDPYEKAGFDVRLITLPDFDVLSYRPPKIVYGILAAPPCDHLAISGAQYWPQKDLDGRTEQALDILDSCTNIISNTNHKFWALENPVGRIPKLRPGLGKPRIIFNPCDYGDPYTKRTCLWGVFNEPKKAPVEPIKVCKQGSWLMRLGGKSDKTKMLRSVTPQGFAKAFFEANR
jgi:hypothetical protein